MTILKIAALLCRIDFSSGPVDERLVPEILLQVIIVGIQHAGMAMLRQCHDVRVIGSTCARLFENRRPFFDYCIVNASRSPFKQRLLQPEPEGMVCTKLSSQLTTDDQLTSSRIDPSAESQAGRRPISPKHLLRDIVVKDGAHDYKPIERLISSMKNRR